MASVEPRACFGCGEVNTPDSRFCKHCGRPLIEQPRPANVAVQDAQSRVMLALVLILLTALVVYGAFGLLTSKFGRHAAPFSYLTTSTLTWPMPLPRG